MKNLRNLILLFAVLTLCAGLQGCLSASTNNTTVSGTAISPATFAQIEPGKTKDYVINLIGQPSQKTTQDNGDDIWTWRYSETKDSSGGLIFVFFSGNKTTTRTVRHVEFKDNVVVKVWTD